MKHLFFLLMFAVGGPGIVNASVDHYEVVIDGVATVATSPHETTINEQLVRVTWSDATDPDVQITVRAVDDAGNVGPESDPVVVDMPPLKVENVNVEIVEQ